MGVVARAGKHVEHGPQAGAGVEHAIRGEEREPLRAGKIHELAVAQFLPAPQMALHLDIDIPRSKRLLEPDDALPRARWIVATGPSSSPVSATRVQGRNAPRLRLGPAQLAG
jgi:hypothetical protein